MRDFLLFASIGCTTFWSSTCLKLRTCCEAERGLQGWCTVTDAPRSNETRVSLMVAKRKKNEEREVKSCKKKKSSEIKLASAQRETEASGKGNNKIKYIEENKG